MTAASGGAIRGRIFDVQRFSLRDGPGIRTTVFLKGCPARCLWCHNPESQSFAPELLVVETRCVSCGTCATVCPQGAPPPGSGLCTACGGCVDACPAGARRLAGRETSVDAVLQEAFRDRVFYEESGGGVTLSGGEPLAQPEFLAALLGACRAAGVHTAVDTCGSSPRERLLALAPLVDLFLFDVKLVDDARHRALTGLPFAPILENLRALATNHGNVWIRVPVVPGCTDAVADVAATAALVAGLPGVRQVSLLPYHRTGAAKSRRLGREYPLDALAPPSPERLEELASLFRQHGLGVRIGA
ncbi:MAG TPA: glycyl-radical enzyme activating protein [Vicinamibacteria bacterium]|nr:glycyl-radical enzyme activating protein [Vicinamibacteria bacterium]